MADRNGQRRVRPMEPLRDQVARELRKAVSLGELRPGVVYSAPALAADFGVSATPVREAMLDLAREGLVEAVRNKGFRVTELTERELIEITEVRTLIEVPTVGRVAKLASAEQLGELRAAAEETVAAAAERDLLRYLEADRRFHLGLLALGGNAQLVEVVADLRTRSRLYALAASGSSELLAASAREHLELLEVMLAGDAGAAQELMRHHLTHVRTLWAAGQAEAARRAALRLDGAG